LKETERAWLLGEWLIVDVIVGGDLPGADGEQSMVRERERERVERKRGELRGGDRGWVAGLEALVRETFVKGDGDIAPV
jgi:hypothetical protein